MKKASEARLDGARTKLGSRQGWNWASFKVPSSPNHPVSNKGNKERAQTANPTTQSLNVDGAH